MAEGDLLNWSLSYLSNEARTTICRLNTRKLLSSDGAGNPPRDYRGLAFCINVSSQDIDNVHQNKTEWLLQTWIRRNDGTANMHTLLLHLEHIDRHDIKDDLLALARTNGLVNRDRAWVGESVVDRRVALPEEDDLVTIDDMEEGAPVIYDALVLYAEADREFVDTMIEKMSRDFGYRLCTKHSLRPGMMPYRSIAELVRDRCRYVILVYSPDFFTSPDEQFFMDYVHAWNIGSNQRRLLPCMFRRCTLPPHYSFYHNLHYNSVAYDFWAHLGRFLNPGRTPRLLAPPPSSTMRIQELNGGSVSNGQLANGRAVAYETQEPSTQTITLPSVPSATNISASTNSLDRPIETASLNDISKIKKKNSITSLLKKPFKIFSRNKNSKKILVSN